MSEKNIVRPRITVLDQQQIQQVHHYSMGILSSIGVRVESEFARKLMIGAIGSSAGRDDRVCIPSELVGWALNAAPSTITVYDRDGSSAFELPDQTRFGIGVTDLYYQDPETNQAVPFSREHMALSVRLGNAMTSFDIISTVGVIQDVAPDVSDLYAALEMTANTVKPLILLVSNEDIFPAVLDLMEHLRGEFIDRPSVIPYFNPITPLVINAGTVDKMRVAIERGLPIIYSNYGMAGATTPITPAGVLALLNAELLAGLVLGQLIKEGAPMILGSLPAYFNMQGKGSFYDPNSYLVDLAIAEMTNHYHLPHAGSSGSGVGWSADLITSGHQWMNHLVSCCGKVGLVPFVGDALGSMVFSPAIIVYANDIIQQVRRFRQGFVLEDAAVAMQDIAEVGPGGHFLLSDLTLNQFRNAYHQSDIFEKLTFDSWQEKGCPRAEDSLRSHTQQLLNECQPPANHDDLLAQGEAFIKSLQLNS
jgi:trimethylamine--corrinoid protein Co-methyltransferase